MSIPKEEAFKLLTELVGMVIEDQGKSLDTNENVKREWLYRKQELDKAMEQMNSCDMCWLNDKYGEWFRENVERKIPPELIEKIHNQL